MPHDLRTVYDDHTTEAERADLALDLEAGADHYRAYVGPPWRYDLIAALQFVALIELGLREFHSVLDVGCGSLRAGRLLIPYLLPDRYFGIEPNARMVEEGLRRHFNAPAKPWWWQRSILDLRRPRFDNNDRFDFAVFGRRFDFILAQSIVSHTGPNQLDAFLQGCAVALAPTGKAFVTYVSGDDCNMPGWHYPECVTYRSDTIADRARHFGLAAKPHSWPAINDHPLGQISPQSIVIIGRRQG